MPVESIAEGAASVVLRGEVNGNKEAGAILLQYFFFFF